MPLAIRLRKPLCSQRRWLMNAWILVNKLADRASIGQMTMNQYFAHIPSIRTVWNASLERIESFCVKHFLNVSSCKWIMMWLCDGRQTHVSGVVYFCWLQHFGSHNF
jgi:hypothetical protein